MTDPKSKGNTKKANEEWEFTDVRKKIKPEMANDEGEPHAKGRIRVPQKQQTLKLDQASVPKARTRSAMASEMQRLASKNEGDIFKLAPFSKRSAAFVIDSAFTAAIVFAAAASAPFWRMLIQIFLDKYNLQLILPETLVMKSIVVLSEFWVLFFCLVIPVAFFNHSLGKKIFGLKVRGNEKYTISISQAFMRELIMKPIGILILAGFVTPFNSKNKLAIHDMAANTIVIED